MFGRLVDLPVHGLPVVGGLEYALVVAEPVLVNTWGVAAVLVDIVVKGRNRSRHVTMDLVV